MHVYTYYKMVVYLLLSYSALHFAEPDCANIKNTMQTNQINYKK